MLVIEADIHEYVGMSYVDKNILGPLVHMDHYCKKNNKLLNKSRVIFEQIEHKEQALLRRY